MTAVHSVEVTPNPDEYGIPTVVFTCTGDRTTKCHIYPDAETWQDDDPRSVPHDECWVQGWFDAGADTYVGDGFIMDVGAGGVPNVARSGPISVSFEDEWIEWEFTA